MPRTFNDFVPDSVATRDINVDSYAAPGDRRMVCLNVDGVTFARVAIPKGMKLRFTSDEALQMAGAATPTAD